MAAISRFFHALGSLIKTPWFLSLFIILLLALFIWFVGPLIAIADHVILEGVVARLVASLILIFCWGIFLVMYYAGKKKRELADPERAKQFEELERDKLTFREEIDHIRSRIKAAVKTVTQSNFYGPKSRSRYALPWYLLLGTSDCGKTSFLLNSGLKFPLNEQADRHLYQLKATEHCEALYGNDAVFLDTPGKYTEARPESPIHNLWMRLLKYVFRARPAGPLNGIIVCVSMRDMMDEDTARREHRARTLRARLSEVLKALHSYVPVYLVFTKCDAVPGFAQFFAHLSRAEREQIFGCPAGEHTMEPGAVRNELKELMQIINAQIIAKIHQERDIPSRGDMFRFPQEIAALGPRLEDFIFAAFGPSRYHKPVMFRGFFFTSALSAQDIFAATAKDGEVTLQTGFQPSLSDYAKGFFLSKLLQEGIISEARLADTDKERIWSLRFQRHGLQVAAAFFFLFAAAFLGVSFTNNYSKIGQLDLDYEAFAKEQRQTPAVHEAKNVLPELAIIEKATTVYDPDEDSAVRYGLGLYYGRTFDKATNTAYLGTLNKRLMPVLRADAAERVDRLLTNTAELKSALMTYIMLCQPRYLVKNFLNPQLDARWSEHYLGQAETQKTLRRHMDYLIAHGIVPVEPDAALLERARKALLKIPLAELVYRQMQDEAVARGEPPFTFRQAIGSSPFAGDTYPIPYLYTHNGYEEYLIKRCPDIIRGMTSNSWIFGTNPLALSSLDVNKVHKDVRAMYFKDYIKYWNQAIQELKVHSPATLADAQKLAEQLTAGISPAVLVLREVRANLNFVVEQQQAEQSKLEAAVTSEATRKVQQKLTSKVGSKVAKALTAQGSENIAELRARATEEAQRDALAVRQYFVHLDALLLPDGNPNPALKAVNDAMLAAGEYFRKLAAADNKEQRVLAALLEIADEKDDTLRQAENAAERLPSSVKGWYSTVVPGGLRAMLLTGAQAINRNYQEKVISSYDSNLRLLYPFTTTADKDANLQDFANFFRSGGILDGFYETYLRPFAARGGQLKSIMGRYLPVSGQAISQLQRANRVQDAFFLSGRELGIHFLIEPHTLDASLKQVDLSNAGKTISYWHGLVQGASFNWPAPAGSNTTAILEFINLNGNHAGGKTARGDWALFRIFQGGTIKSQEDNTCLIEVQQNSHWAQFLIQFRSKVNPFDPTVCSFTLPDSLL